MSRCTRPAGAATAGASRTPRGHRLRRGEHRGRTRARPRSWSTVNGGNRTVPTLVFADGTALTNPCVEQVKAQARRLSVSRRLSAGRRRGRWPRLGRGARWPTSRPGRGAGGASTAAGRADPHALADVTGRAAARAGRPAAHVAGRARSGATRRCGWSTATTTSTPTCTTGSTPTRCAARCSTRSDRRLGPFLPSLRDPATNRATREPPISPAADQVRARQRVSCCSAVDLPFD